MKQNQRTKRLGEVIRVLTRYGFADWVSDDTPDYVKRWFEEPDGRMLTDYTRAERVRLALTELGAAYIKLGQMLSTRDDLVGPDMAGELKKLQAETPPDPPDTVAEVVTAELGKPADELYAEFDFNALASASVGQVQAAELHDGTQVVVKLLHHGIEEKVTLDLDLMGQLATLLAKHGKDLPFDPVSLIRDFRLTLLNEIDLRHEFGQQSIHHTIKMKGKSMSTPLSSWNEGKTKDTILQYVQSVTDPALDTFVPVADRIATFDNDGCCWNEKPAYIQLCFALSRLKEMATDDPTLLDRPHFKAAYEGDMGYFANLDPHAGGDIKQLMKVMFDSHAGMSQDEFMAMAHEFMITAVHPHFDVPYVQMVYQPMVELIHYLHEHDFKVFLCSAGGMSFMRSVSEEAYGISKERVIGSNLSFETQMTDDGPVVIRKPGIIEPIDDGPGKPINIELHIGRKPILAGGNSDGDLHMLWLAQTGNHPSLSLLVHHDDAEREYAYDIGSEKTLEMAPKRGWTVVSMKNDWNRIFAWA